MATGRYAISEGGLIVASAKHNDTGLGKFYRLKNGVITGSRGPAPHVEWIKQSLNAPKIDR